MSEDNPAREWRAGHYDMSLPSCEGKPQRTFKNLGSTWRVCEDTCPVRHVPCLIFFGPGVGRRVLSYPADWRTLDDAALIALSESR